MPADLALTPNSRNLESDLKRCSPSDSGGKKSGFWILPLNPSFSHSAGSLESGFWNLNSSLAWSTQSGTLESGIWILLSRLSRGPLLESGIWNLESAPCKERYRSQNEVHGSQIGVNGVIKRVCRLVGIWILESEFFPCLESPRMGLWNLDSGFCFPK